MQEWLNTSKQKALDFVHKAHTALSTEATTGIQVLPFVLCHLHSILPFKAPRYCHAWTFLFRLPKECHYAAHDASSQSRRLNHLVFSILLDWGPDLTLTLQSTFFEEPQISEACSQIPCDKWLASKSTSIDWDALCDRFSLEIIVPIWQVNVKSVAACEVPRSPSSSDSWR